jgi:hypothetical protein
MTDNTTARTVSCGTATSLINFSGVFSQMWKPASWRVFRGVERSHRPRLLRYRLLAARRLIRGRATHRRALERAVAE